MDTLDILGSSDIDDTLALTESKAYRESTTLFNSTQ